MVHGVFGVAHFRIEVKSISRGQGRSVVAAAAYRAAEKLHDKRQGLEHDYERKEGVERSEIIAPDDAPDWARDRASLWNAADAAEKRKDAITARELVLSLPRDLGEQERVELVRDFIRSEFTSRGIVADVSWHKPEARDGHAQPHAHVLLTDRAVSGEGFAAKKDRTLAQGEGVEALRASWAMHVNNALERAQVPDRVDHRSLERQRVEALGRAQDPHQPEAVREAAQIRAVELNRPPEPKIGPVAMAMHRQGRGDQAHALRDADQARQARQAVEDLARQMREVRDRMREIAQQALRKGREMAERLREGLQQAAMGGLQAAAAGAAVERLRFGLAAADLGKLREANKQRPEVQRQEQAKARERDLPKGPKPSRGRGRGGGIER